MKTGTLKEEERRLKKNIIENLESQFVDEFEKWREKVDLFNKMVVIYNNMNKGRLGLVTYDEFCCLFVKGSKRLLDEQIRMEHILPNEGELDVMRTTMEDAENADEFKKKYAVLMEAKYAQVRRKLADTWDEHIFRFIIHARYGSRHYEKMLVAKREVMKTLD